MEEYLLRAEALAPRSARKRQAWTELREGASCRFRVVITRRHSNRREFVLQLIVYYIVFMIAGDLAAYVIGFITEEAFGSQASLIVFLALYFLFLWVAWVLAVWITEPKHTASISTESA